MNDLNSPVVLAIDIGSSSVRALTYTSTGAPLPIVAIQQQYAPTLTSDGGAVFDPIKLCQAVFACLDQASTQLTAAHLSIKAVGVDTFATNLFGVDAADQPITPVYLWNDTRSRAYTMPPGVEPVRAYERTGAPFYASYWLPRLRWLKATQPEVFAKAARWLSIGEWLQETLFGVRGVSTSLAAWTGLLDRRSGMWDTELLIAAGIRIDQLSPIDDQPLGKLLDRYAKRLTAFAKRSLAGCHRGWLCRECRL